MNDNVRKLSPGIYAIIILCFFLPFASLSCQGRTMAKISAIQMVTGTTVEGTQVPPEALAILVFSLAILGLVLGFLKFENSDLCAALVGAVAFVLTIVLKSGIEDDVAMQSYGAFEVDSEIGYLLLLLLFLVAMGVNGYVWKRRNFPNSEKVVYCSACRTKNLVTNHKCSDCDQELDVF